MIDSTAAGLHVKGENGQRTLPPAYVHTHVELAYATTAYGAQGSTVETAHVLVGDHTGAASAYVAMTRGRHHNTAHLVADNIDDARNQWIQVFGRNRADLGPSHAAAIAAQAIDRYGPMQTPHARRARRPPTPRQRPPAPAATPTYRPPASTPPPSIGL